MLKLLVFEYKVVDYKYFMDELRQWEVQNIIDNLTSSVKNDWEKTRFISFWTARPHYKKLKINDIATFEWENDNRSIKSEIKTTDEDIKQLKELFKNNKRRQE